MENSLQSLYQLVENLPGSYVVFETVGAQIGYLYHSTGVNTLLGLDDTEGGVFAKGYQLVLEDDRAMVGSALQSFMEAQESQSTQLLFRMIHRVKGFIWVHMSFKKFGMVEGKNICLANLVDSTKETMIAYALMDASDRYVCVIERSSKRILYGNEKFFDLIDSTPAQAVGKHCYECLCKVMEMRDNDNCLCYSSLNADPPIETYNAAKKMNITITGREVVWGEYDAYVFFMTDITEKKQREAELADSQKRFEVALANSDLMIWEYDILNHRCITSQKATAGYNIPLIIENYPESLYTMGHTPPETVEQIKECKRRLLNGETGFSVERRTIRENGESEWQKVEYTLECDEKGRPVRAIMCGLDITRQKELEAKYEEQMEYRNKLAQNAMFSIRLDLDENRIEDYTSTDSQLSALVQKACGADDFLESFFQTSLFEADSGLSRAALTKAALTETYTLGQSQIHTVYRCSLLNLYLELNLTMYKNPGTQHLEVFFVIVDVTGAELMQNAFRRIVKANYDFVAVIDPKTHKMMFLAHADGTPLPAHLEPDAMQDYDAMVTEFAQEHRKFYHTETDYFAVGEGMQLSYILQKLSQAPSYEFNCKARNQKGEVNTYRLSFSYSDANRDQIMFTRANITQAVLEEQKSQQLLEQALNTARQANKAKTDFLSRMSHDMRTPMNGIIGMTHLTQDIPDLPAEAQENLSSIEESSAYLLQLINDTLDMNKIESSRFTLHPETVNVQELITRILSGVQLMAARKKIQLEFVPIHTELDYVRLDRVRVQQIFLNILSNAVKFTPENGRIRIEAECLRREENVTYVRISVEDTGCGMSPEFLSHIYEPFTQENTRIVNGQEGTGLGMSIVKNLVELMGGRIEIASKPGAGTKVTVYLNFTRVHGVEHTQLRQETAGLDTLAGRHILLAEDHPLNASIAIRLLKKKGVTTEHAENGAAAVQMFAASAPGHFDAILMDIRMPEMDGLTAARKIRGLDRAEAKTIPIIAMTANAYAEDVQAALEAGMNTHLAKPVEPEMLYTALRRFIR